MKASHLAVSSLVRGSLVCFAIVLLVAPAARPFEQPHVTVTPGTPNVWSMEQAHYLLNRLRANRDGIQLAKPSEGDLNPNATHGIRLDAIQTFLGIAASFNQIAGTQNRLALEEYNANTGRKRELLDLADAKRRQAQAAQLESIRLQQEEALLKTQIAAATDPQAKAALEAKAAALLAQRQALDSTVTVLAAQVTDLTTAAGQAASSVPSLTATDAEINKQIQAGLLGSAFTALLNKSVTGFSEPKLHSSQVLDNFVQMQYEIVAKQLTTLRDEAGKGQRVVFLELPTSVAAGNERKFVSGGQNRLAQSWWQIKTVYLGYSRDSSPCWIGGSDVYDGMQSLLFLEGHGESVDQVPTMQKIKPGKPGDASDELARAVAQWLNVELNQLDKEPAAQDSEKDRIQTRVKNIRRWPTTARDWAKSAIEDLGDLTDRLRQAREKAFEAETKYLAGVAKGRQAKAERQALLDAMTTLARTESLRVERGKTASAAW